jgi:hypothetical protein
MPIAPESGNDPVAAPPEKTAEARPRRGWATILWALVACILLGSSAVVRGVQERRHQDEASYLASCPFPLKQIPTTLGVWQLAPEGDMTLDKLTMRITGGTDYILRTYADDLTGVKLVVLLLFGPVEPVVPHTPEVCYPANGFGTAEDSMIRELEYSYRDPGGQEARRKASFRSAVYQKSVGRGVIREGVFYSFRLDGQWSPDVASGKKFPRRNPGVFKVQVQRIVVEGERRNDKTLKDPIEEFLTILIPEIEREIAAAASKDLAKK